MALTNKQKVFVEEYLLDFNATQAALRAGYSARSARQIGQQNLSKVDIAEAIKERIDEKAMKADEVLLRLAQMARGDIGEFMDISQMGYSLNLYDAKEAGITHLIKKVKQKTTTFLAKSESQEDREVTELELELYDAKDALVQLGRHHVLFTDKNQLIGKNGEPLRVEFEYINSPYPAPAVSSGTSGNTQEPKEV